MARMGWKTVYFRSIKLKIRKNFRYNPSGYNRTMCGRKFSSNHSQFTRFCVSMKNFLTFLFLFLSGVNVYARYEWLDRSLWSQFDTIFGSSLHHVFATEDALQNAYDFTNNSSSKALHYSCATYKDGSNIGEHDLFNDF